ncbi:hypothetical protein BGW38_006067 [Lunasporangiospora selenospora]|uniref:Uncharacterized protein n=1 Tax=Lunasporangiospora selenospora TaxID=979761 RepID=A0A9P6FZ75_9FUNG|nr:hypothetical protein BGW38_006067 [Lunasporangiospora selenospora]
MFAVQCLWCGVENVMDSPTFIKFRIDNDPIECGGCESQCSLETLSSKRFWDGIGAYRADPSILLVGSLLSPWTGTPDALTAQREHHHLFFHPRIQFGLDQASFSLNCTWPKIIQAFQGMGPDQYYGIRPTTIPRIISSYRGLVDDRLSMDLVAGALRQRDFQRAMMVTGGQAWCHPDVLDRMLERYKMFMLVSRAESKHGGGAPGQHALVPTLDIDLAWHTHMLSPAHYRQYQLVHYGRVLNHDDTVQATSAMTKQDFVRTAELWHDVFHEQYSSQLSGQFLWTPGKVCASVCCPPYGAYLAWKSWRSKRKVKKMAKKQQQKREEQAKKRAQRESTLDSNVEKDQETGTQGGDHVHSNGSTVLVLEKDQQEQRASMETQEGIEDIKGKGRCVESLPMTEVSTVGAESSTSGANRATTKASDTRSIPPRSMTPALGLDGRLSNWNSDPKGLDGQALCSSGACIMSTWNEVQELSPFVELQQHQRELRTQRT